MPTIEQRVRVEKHMNNHWDALMAQKAVISTHWRPGENIGVSRQEHHFLSDKKLERENLALYNKLYGIVAGNTMSETAQLIEGSGDSDRLQILSEHKDWQRQHDRQEKQDEIDRKNLKLYHTLSNTKSLVQSAEAMAKEYKDKHSLVDSYTKNKVKEVELHLNIRHYHSHPNATSSSPLRPKSANSPYNPPPISPLKTHHNYNQINPNHNKQSKKISKSVLQTASSASTMTGQNGRMPAKFRNVVRPKSAGTSHKRSSSRSRKHSKQSTKQAQTHTDIQQIYQRLMQRAASTMTSEDIESYVSDHQYDYNVEDDVYHYVYGDASGYEGDQEINMSVQYCEDSSGTSRQQRHRHQNRQQQQSVDADVAKVLFEETNRTRSPSDKTHNRRSDNCQISPEHQKQQQQQQQQQPMSTSSTPRSSVTPHFSEVLATQGMSRRHLFTETQLQAPIRVCDQSDSDDLSKQDAPSHPYFVIRMYDVGESCDLQHLSPSKNPASIASPAGRIRLDGVRKGEKVIVSPPLSPIVTLSMSIVWCI